MILNLAVECHIDRPKSGNSFGLQQAQALARALNEAEAAQKPLVLAASGRFFCAGGDVKAYADFDEREPGLKINREIRAVLEKVHASKVPTLALVQGDCFGGGVELISCFDKVIAAHHACFGFWQRRIGLSFGWGGGSRLLARMGERRLATLALEGGSFSAERALALGLIDEVVGTHALKKRGQEWLQKVAALSKFPLPVLRNFPQNEVAGFEKIWMNDDHRESLRRVRKSSTN